MGCRNMLPNSRTLLGGEEQRKNVNLDLWNHDLRADRPHQREPRLAAAMGWRVGVAVENSFKAHNLLTTAQATRERS